MSASRKRPAKSRKVKSAKSNGQPGPRLGTGVAGLDQILGGGLPPNRLYLVQGAPGTGKTTLGLQFLRAGAAEGEKVMYVSLSQSRAELDQIAYSHGWTLDGIEIAELTKADEDPRVMDQTIFHTADLRLDRTRSEIERIIRQMKPSRVVYDSLIEIRHLTGEDSRYRRELLGFKAFLDEQHVAAMLLDTETNYGGDSQVEGLAHGVFKLEKALPEYGVARRRIEVKKMRGVAFADGYHDFAIRTGGVEVYPRIVPELALERTKPHAIKSGIVELDDMLGGGLEAGTTALVVGQAGTGKSTLGSLYAHAALARGEAVALFLFEERIETFFRRCEGLGMNMRGHAKKGLLSIRDFNPAEISPGEFSQIVQKAVDENDVKVVLIDSFTGYVSALPHGQQAVTQLHTLLKYLARSGVLTILIAAQHGLLGRDVHSDIDLSFLGDSVLLLRMFEWPGAVRRSITAVKKRHGPHNLNVFELVISGEGVAVREYNPPPLGPSGPMPSETR